MDILKIYLLFSGAFIVFLLITTIVTFRERVRKLECQYIRSVRVPDFSMLDIYIKPSKILIYLIIIIFLVMNSVVIFHYFDSDRFKENYEYKSSITSSSEISKKNGVKEPRKMPLPWELKEVIEHFKNFEMDNTSKLYSFLLLAFIALLVVFLFMTFRKMGNEIEELNEVHNALYGFIIGIRINCFHRFFLLVTTVFFLFNNALAFIIFAG